MTDEKINLDEVDALNAILEEAEKLLTEDLPDGISEKVSLISAIASYRHDVRANQEKDSL